MKPTNYIKVVSREGGKLVDIFAFDAELEPDIRRAYDKALAVRLAKPDRKLILGAPVAIRGPWNDLPITGVNTVRVAT